MFLNDGVVVRTKTEVKREAILSIAIDVFLEKGFEGTSMSDIAARVGGSKRTLYGYFPSKEALFVEAVRSTGEELFQPLFDEFEHLDTPLPLALRRFGQGMSQAHSEGPILHLLRAMIGVAGRSDVGKKFFEQGPRHGEQILARYLSAQMDAGALKVSDPLLAARHFVALLQAEVLLPRLLNVPMDTSPQEVAAMTERAVDAFLVLYRLEDRATP
ncbi:TetR/AcrR family transcriptional regulator [Stenotrophomonas rhizophila]|uniref:TetR/AcrR family transcriptional regulator n=1 Tax=Stenotrophomonas rhizophila TaxID=216778 RepID=UPI0033965A37